MITEDYVSFETAKLLKEKGFPQEYDRYHSLVYNEEDYEDEYEVQRMVLETRIVKAGTLSSYPLGVPEPKCYCPTLQMALKWLREVHKIDIEVRTHYLNRLKPNDIRYYSGKILKGSEDVIHTIYGKDTYEEVCEAAIKYCLENLI